MLVTIESPRGNIVDDFLFDPGQQIIVVIRNVNMFALVNVNLDIVWTNNSIAPYHQSKTADWLGNADFTVTLPYTASKGNMSVEELDPFAKNYPIVYSIGVGMIPAPSPKPYEPPNLFDDFNKVPETLSKTLRYALIGAGVLGVIWIASKLGPDIAKGAGGSMASYARSRR